MIKSIVEIVFMLDNFDYMLGTAHWLGVHSMYSS